MSHTGVQVFGHSHGVWPTSVPEKTAPLQTRRFALLPLQNFLLLLPLPGKTNRTKLVEVSSQGIKEFDTMMAGKQFIRVALLKYEEE